MGEPTWMYRVGDGGKVEAKIFDSDEVPAGWSDSPADPPKKRGPKPKAKPQVEE